VLENTNESKVVLSGLLGHENVWRSIKLTASALKEHCMHVQVYSLSQKLISR
jgi:hypothetical protein